MSASSLAFMVACDVDLGEHAEPLVGQRGPGRGDGVVERLVQDDRRCRRSRLGHRSASAARRVLLGDLPADVVHVQPADPVDDLLEGCRRAGRRAGRTPGCRRGTPSGSGSR